MKAKNILLLAAFTTAFVLSGCKQEEPFDTQSENDAPLILKPYNESGTGSFTYQLANPDTPLFDSVVVTPSRYTTVNWYLNDALIYTGTKINMTLPAGTYKLVIEAVTSAGKKTQRFGSVIVKPNAADPFAAAPAVGRYCVPGFPLTLSGQNLSKVKALVVTKDVEGKDVVQTIEVTNTDDAALTITLPAELATGNFFLRLRDAEGNLFGSDAILVCDAPLAMEGFAEFIPGDTWTITGLNLAGIQSVTLNGAAITDLTVTETSVTFVAPNLEEGRYTLSMTDARGQHALFITNDGAVEEVMAAVSSETVIWGNGPVALDWNADLVNISAATMASVPVGSTILVYFEIPEAEYHNMRITTPWWGDDLVAQFDVTEATPNPFTFTYDDRCKGIVDMVGSWSIVGFGETINKITFK